MPNPAAELRELPEEELLSRLESAKEELFNLRFQLATGQLDNPSMIKRVRHDIARIATVLRQRESEEELEVQVTRADEGSLAEGREEQRTTKRRRLSLRQMERDALDEQQSEAKASEEEA